MNDVQLISSIKTIVSKYIYFENDIEEVTKYLVTEKLRPMNWNSFVIRTNLLSISQNSSYYDIDRIINEIEELCSIGYIL